MHYSTRARRNDAEERTNVGSKKLIQKLLQISRNKITLDSKNGQCS